MLAWTVLALVFLDELLAVAAAATWGAVTGGPVLAVVSGAAVLVVWFLFASPKARFGHPVGRPVVKVAVFTLAAVGLAAVWSPVWAVAFLVFSVAVSAAAQLPSVRAAAEAATQVPPRNG